AERPAGGCRRGRAVVEVRRLLRGRPGGRRDGRAVPWGRGPRPQPRRARRLPARAARAGADPDQAAPGRAAPADRAAGRGPRRLAGRAAARPGQLHDPQADLGGGAPGEVLPGDRLRLAAGAAGEGAGRRGRRRRVRPGRLPAPVEL
ncbi:MAG: hypothetical protein AVDCRST_MAG21-101, partial [uncultured Nocardioidaceae bacterium]